MKKVLKRQKDIKHVLIIHPEGNSFNNPSLKCIIDLLLEKGCKIDLRYKCSHAPVPSIKGIRLISYKKILSHIKSFFFDRLCNWKLTFLMVLLEKYCLYDNCYDLIIGVDRHGLIEANILHRLYTTPYILISFEVTFESETSDLYKSLERKASKDIALWIVQDEVRAEQLIYENDLHPAKKFLLPLASSGLGYFKKERLRDILGISPNKKVAIIIGSVAKWSMTSQILKVVINWPEDWVLIVHERYGRTSKCLKDELMFFDENYKKKIFISNAATEFIDDMGGILAGVSVGIALYQPDFNDPNAGKNLKYLGLASGKISTYLRYGVPVILNEVGLYAEEAKKYRFGCIVCEPIQIKDKLEKVSQVEFQNNAREYFSKKLDFNNYSEELFDRISTLI